MRSKLIAAAACASLPTVALAQAVGSGTNYQTPSAPNYQAPVVPPKPAYTLPSLSTPDAGTAPGPQATGGAQVFVKHIDVKGVTAFPPNAIRALVQPYENRAVSASELQSLRVALTRLYVDKGYISSGVLLPDSDAKDGVVVYQAVEGSLTRVDVSGHAKLKPGYVASRVRANVSTPLNVGDLQYALRSLQVDPNVQRLDARFGPGDAPGQSVLKVNVEEKPRFSAGIGVDNHHSASTGDTAGNVFFDARDLTGWGDELRATVGRSRGDTEGSGLYSIPISAHNAALQLYYSSASAVIIQQPFKTLNIESRTRTAGFSLTAPLHDRLDNRFVVFIGGEAARSSTALLGTPFSFSPGAQDGVSKVATVLGGVDWTVHGASSVTDVRLTYKRGLDALGATIYNPSAVPDPMNPNPTGADGRFGLEQLQFIHIERLNGFGWLSGLNDRAQFAFRVSGQLTQKPLLSLAKYTVGGVNTVRGLPENLLVRDNGVASGLELQLPIPGYRAEPGPRNLVLVPFVDYGRSWDKLNADPGNPLLNTATPRYFATAGVGLLWNAFRGFDAQLYWGHKIADNFHGDNPLDYAAHDLQYHGFHFAVNYTYRW